MKIVYPMLGLLLLLSCANERKENDQSNDDIDQESIYKNQKRAFYEAKMKEKNFALEMNGSCDESSIDLEKEISYDIEIQNKRTTNHQTIVDFKFINACCQDFLGDYIIINDTLFFYIEQVNEESCECLCCYPYRLTLNEIDETYQEIIIDYKKNAKQSE